MNEDSHRWKSQNKKLKAAQELTAEIVHAVDKYLTTQIGDPTGCNKAPFLADGNYPDREDIKNAVNTIWDGIHALYRIDPEARKVQWRAGFPFVSNGDSQWLLGGSISVDPDQ